MSHLLKEACLEKGASSARIIKKVNIRRIDSEYVIKIFGNGQTKKRYTTTFKGAEAEFNDILADLIEEGYTVINLDDQSESYVLRPEVVELLAQQFPVGTKVTVVETSRSAQIYVGRLAEVVETYGLHGDIRLKMLEKEGLPVQSKQLDSIHLTYNLTTIKRVP